MASSYNEACYSSQCAAVCGIIEFRVNSEGFPAEEPENVGSFRFDGHYRCYLAYLEQTQQLSLNSVQHDHDYGVYHQSCVH